MAMMPTRARRQEMAWKSLDRVNRHVFESGDAILFRSGTSYQGQLKPQGCGKVVDGMPRPIVIDRYGPGDKPRIDGHGVMPATLHLDNTEYWEVRNLEITNEGESRKGNRCGVLVSIEDFGTAHHVHLVGLHVHDVNGSLIKKQGGGSAIRWSNRGKQTPSRFDGLRIEGCHLARCERNGINAKANTRRDDSWFPSLNVVIRDNLLEQIPGDGIVPIGCDAALIEHNCMRDCPRLLPPGEAAAGIWPWSCDNTVIQHNEVSDHKAPWDAQGFDSDWNCRNTLIQYNYSHDNEGGFLLVCNNGGARTLGNVGNIGTVVRYNISVNDGLRPDPTQAKGMFSPTFHISGPCLDTKIYNNLIYIPKKPNQRIDRTLLKMDNWGGPWPSQTLFANNIFYTEEQTSYDLGKANHTVFQNNLYFGAHQHRPDDPQAILADPCFLDRGDLPGQRFQLLPTSPCIGTGRILPDRGDFDYAGTRLRLRSTDDRPARVRA